MSQARGGLQGLVKTETSSSHAVYRPPLSPDSVEWEGRSLLKALIKKSALW